MNLASYAVVVEALDDGVTKFYEQYGFRELGRQTRRHIRDFSL